MFPFSTPVVEIEHLVSDPKCRERADNDLAERRERAE
jgi:hypothetical protein